MSCSLPPMRDFSVRELAPMRNTRLVPSIAPPVL
jgi:hypothetical protein